MKSPKVYCILYFYLIIVNVQSYRKPRTEIPMNLKHIYVIYNSWFTIGYDRPTISFEYVYFVQGNVLKAFNYKKLIFSAASIFYPFGDNYYIKPIDSYTMTSFNLYSIFFTKDCKIRSYNYDDKFFNYNNMHLNLIFDELKGDNCYDSLRMYYDFRSKYFAVYNTNSRKIIVFDLDPTSIYSSPRYTKWLDKSMNGGISKALIFSNINKQKALLIGIDVTGQVNFWNIKGYSSGFFNAISLAYNDDLIKSFKFNNFYTFTDQEIATIINKNKLLYINHDDFITFDLEEIELLNNQKNFIKGVSCVLGLEDGNALVGTEDGFIYLIKYEYSEIVILDKRELCPHEIIFSLSSNSNCTPETYTCYIFVANCHYLKIFEIKHPSTINDHDL